MAGIDYNKLYKLQDKVLAIVFETEKIFYLTGGTCLSRFYIEKRYSDDLDLFANNESRFNLAVKNVKTVLLKKFSVNTEVDGKDFIRLKINGLLQVDIVNDRVASNANAYFNAMKNVLTSPGNTAIEMAEELTDHILKVELKLI